MAKAPQTSSLVQAVTIEQIFAELVGDSIDERVNQDPVEAQRDIVARILASEDADEVLGGTTAVHARDVLGLDFELRDVRFLRSAFEGIGVFAVLDGVLVESGEVVPITCGSTNVMAQAAKLKDLGALPRNVKIMEATTPTAAGYRPMWLHAGGDGS